MQVSTQFSANESIGATIVTAVASLTGTHPRNLPVLQERLDVDSLESLVTPPTVAPDAPVTVEFEFAGCTVAVSNDGTLAVTETGSPNHPMDPKTLPASGQFDGEWPGTAPGDRTGERVTDGGVDAR